VITYSRKTRVFTYKK